jgi:hypothetical protein
MITPYKKPSQTSTKPTSKTQPKSRDKDVNDVLKRKIDNMLSFYTRRYPYNFIESASEQLKHYIDSGQIKQFRFDLGGNSKLNTLLTAGLMTIAINNNDDNAKKIVEKSLLPSENPIFRDRIIRSYNSSGSAEFPIEKLTNDVIKIVDDSFHYAFNDAWKQWIHDNTRENKIILGGFIGEIDSRLTGKQGKFTGSGFPHRWNSYNKSPNKFKQEPAGPQKIDQSKHTISDIVKYIYGKKDNEGFARMDAFNKANAEIYKLLFTNIKNPLIAKAFDGVVGSKLDYDEIASSSKDFKKDPKFVKSVFQNLQKSAQAVNFINNTYKKFGLKLPSFNTWTASDLNKGPSDRGELTPEKPEIGRDPKGNLAKIKYDKYGEKSYIPLQELRNIIKEILQKLLINN